MEPNNSTPSTPNFNPNPTPPPAPPAPGPSIPPSPVSPSEPAPAPIAPPVPPTPTTPISPAPSSTLIIDSTPSFAAPASAPTSSPNPFATPAPASTPTPAPFTTEPTSTNAPVIPTIEPKKKGGKVGKIIALIIAIIIVIGGAVAAFFAISWYNSPEKITYDAMNNLLNAKAATVSGTYLLEFKDQNFPIKKALFTVDEKAQSLTPNQASVLAAVTTSKDQVIELDLGMVVFDSNKIYFSINGITEAFDQLLKVFKDSGDIKDSDLAPLQPMIDDIYALAKKVDGEWWEISMDEVFKQIDPSDKAKGNYNEAFSCIKNATDSISNSSQEYMDYYNKNQFLKVSPVEAPVELQSGETFYTLGFDNEKTANFLNSVADSKAATELKKCSEKMANSPESDKTDVEYIQKTLKDLPKIYLGIKDRKFSGIYTSFEDDNTSSLIDFNFTWPDSINVEIPGKFQSADILGGELNKFYTKYQ